MTLKDTTYFETTHVLCSHKMLSTLVSDCNRLINCNSWQMKSNVRPLTLVLFSCFFFLGGWEWLQKMNRALLFSFVVVWTQCRFFGEKKKLISFVCSTLCPVGSLFTKVFLNWSRGIILQGSGLRGRYCTKVEKFWIFPNRVDVRVIAIDYNGYQSINFRRIWIDYLSR